MKSLRKYLWILLFLIFPIITGCSSRLADMTVISTRNVTLDKVDLDTLPQIKGIKGRDSKFIFLFIPFGFPHLEEAIDEALDVGSGDVMIDAVVYKKFWWFLVGESAIEIRGTVVDTRRVNQ